MYGGRKDLKDLKNAHPLQVAQQGGTYSVETSSEFKALSSMELLIGLRYKLQTMDDGDPAPTLKKKSNSIAYH